MTAIPVTSSDAHSVTFQWNLKAGDDGEPAQVFAYAEIFVQVIGARVAIEASLDSKTWVTVASVGDGEVVDVPSYRYIRPNNPDEDTIVILFAHKVSPGPAF